MQHRNQKPHTLVSRKNACSRGKYGARHTMSPIGGQATLTPPQRESPFINGYAPRKGAMAHIAARHSQ